MEGEQKMYCLGCGKEIPDGTPFCTYCGMSQSAGEMDIQYPEFASAKGNSEQSSGSELRQTSNDLPEKATPKLEHKKADDCKASTVQQKVVYDKKHTSRMKCPRCGSEDIQFATRTSGSLFSASDSCCGFLLLGPLGLLCGLCGSDVSTDEFWVCRNCGKKFTESDVKVKEKEERESAKNYQRQKEILSTAGNKTHEEIEADVAKTEAEHSAAVDDYKGLLNKFATGDDPKLRKSAKIVKRDVWSAAAWLGLSIGLILAFAGDSEIGLLAAIVCAIYLLIHSLRSKKAKKVLAEADPEFPKKFKATQDTAERNQAAKNLQKVSQSVKDYESKYDTKK